MTARDCFLVYSPFAGLWLVLLVGSLVTQALEWRAMRNDPEGVRYGFRVGDRAAAKAFLGQAEGWFEDALEKARREGTQ